MDRDCDVITFRVANFAETIKIAANKFIETTIKKLEIIY